MFIAFEGPDKTGKSTLASRLAASGEGIYNVTKDKHQVMQKDHEEAPELPITYDRIDWLTHMVYRLALPDHEWNDPRVRTVFAMPDTHLIFRLHSPGLAGQIDDELYKRGTLVKVNEAYSVFAHYLMHLNQMKDYELFKTITIMEVFNPPASDEFRERVVDFSGPVFPFGTSADKIVRDHETLLEFLRHVETNMV